jgi:hypothetical protein
MTFSNVDDLVKQMDQDGEQARKILVKYQDSRPHILVANKGSG